MFARSNLVVAVPLLLILSAIPSGLAEGFEFEAIPDQYTAIQATPLVADGSAAKPAGVGGNDVCVDVWELASPPADGELVLNPDGTFIYTPPPNFIGTASFSYRGALLSPELVSASAVWNYFTPDGTDPAIADPDFNESWHTLGYDDSSWLQGSGAMGRGGFGGQNTPDTLIAGANVATYYFRHRIDVPAGSYDLSLDLVRDDGAIIYLDGQEVARSHPANATAFATAADAYDLLVGTNADEFTVFREALGTHTLAAGAHVIAISAHNSNLGGSDHGIRVRSMQAGKLESEEQQVTVFVADGHLPPILADDYFAVATDGVLQASVLENDRLSDASGSAYDPILEILLVSGSPEGDFELDVLTGQFSFDPAPGFTGIAQASYQVRDKDGLSEIARIYIAVTPPDTGEILLGDDAFTLSQGSTLQTGAGVGRSVLLNDLHASRAILAEPASYGAVKLAEGGELIYSPHPNFIGTDSFTYSSLLISPAAAWKFLHPLDGVDPAIADPDFNSTWATPGFDDASWSDGVGLMGYGVIGTRSPDTDIGTPPSTGGQMIRKTAYFRTSFNSPVGGFLDLKMDLIRDDAAIIYLNGMEIGRSHPDTSGPFADEPDVYDLMFPTGSAAGPASEALPASEQFGAAQILAGANVLAVSVHNGGATSSDLALAVLSVSTAASATVSLHVQDSGSVPQIRPDQVIGKQGDPVAGTLYANDGLFDLEGNAFDPILDIEASGPLAPFITSLDRETGEFQLEPPADLIGSAEFFYRVADKDGWSEPAAVTLHIQPDAVLNPFVRLAPLGGSAAASLGTPLEIAGSDLVDVTLPALRAGTLSVALRSPSPSPIQAAIALVDSSGQTLASASAPAGGATLLEFETVLPQPGRYKFVIENQSASPLAASLDVYSNAHVSREQGASMGSAIALDPMFTAVAGGGGEAANLVVEADLSKFSGAVVFEEDFEAGTLGPEWKERRGRETGTIDVSSARGAADGSQFALILGGDNLKWVARTVDLSGVANPILRFAHASWDERAAGVITDGVNRATLGDGVRISIDEEEWFSSDKEWYSLFIPPEFAAEADWFNFEIDLKKFSTREGYSIDGMVYLQFAQDGGEEDARGYDEIKIMERPADVRWQRFSLADGDTLSAEIASLEAWTGDLSVEISDLAGNILAAAPPGTEAAVEFTDTSVDGVPQEYFLRVGSARTAYSLALFRGNEVAAAGLGQTPRTHRGLSRGFLSMPGQEFVAAVVENVSSDVERAALASLIRSWEADCVLAVGSHLIYSNRRELDDWDTYFGNGFGEFILGRIDNRFPNQTSPTPRLFPLVGTSDLNPSDSVIGGSLEDYLEYFHENPGGEKRLPTDGGSFHSIGESYYQFRCGPIQFFFLDSPHALENPESHRRQRHWLQSGLRGSDARWKFIVSDDLPYSNFSFNSRLSPEMRWEGEWLGATAVIGCSSDAFEHIRSGGVEYFAAPNFGGGFFGSRTPGTRALYASGEDSLIKITANRSGVRLELVKSDDTLIYRTDIGNPGLDHPSDLFQVELVAGTPINLATSIPPTVGGLPNTLALSLEVRDPDGILVASGESASDGQNAAALVVPTQTGTYQVEVSTAGGSGEYFLSTRPPSGWQLWRLEHFGQLPDAETSGELDDPDRDWKVNLIEYAFATDPNAPELGQAIVTIGGRSLLLRFPESPAADIAYDLQISNDLDASGWTTIASKAGVGDWSGVQPTTIEGMGGATLLEFALPGEERIFARFSVSRLDL